MYISVPGRFPTTADLTIYISVRSRFPTLNLSETWNDGANKSAQVGRSVATAALATVSA